MTHYSYSWDCNWMLFTAFVNLSLLVCLCYSLSFSLCVWVCMCACRSISLVHLLSHVCVLSVCAHTTSICVIYVWLTGAVVVVVVSARVTRCAQVYYSTRIFSIFILSFTMCRLNVCTYVYAHLHSYIFFAFHYSCLKNLFIYFFLFYKIDTLHKRYASVLIIISRMYVTRKSLHSLWI